MKHEDLEKNMGLMGVFIVLVISVAGLVEILPLFYQTQVIEPAPNVTVPPLERIPP